MDFAHDREIPAGSRYWVVTEYPSADAGYAKTAGHPIDWKVCLFCRPLPIKEKS